MARSAFVLGAVALLVAAVDLAHKAVVVAEPGGALLRHERSLWYVAGTALVALLWSLAVAATGSRGLACVAGLVAGGAAGNAISAAVWAADGGTPNPFLVGDEHFGLAFNLADAFVALGVLLLLPAVSLFALRNRHRLHERVAFGP